MSKAKVAGKPELNTELFMADNEPPEVLNTTFTDRTAINEYIKVIAVVFEVARQEKIEITTGHSAVSGIQFGAASRIGATGGISETGVDGLHG